MADTPNLALPLMAASQAQKHVTHNEGLRMLDGLVHLSVVNRTLTSPPGSPAAGARYIVAAGATGLWAGWDNDIAFWIDGAWMRLEPQRGWLAWVQSEDWYRVWNGTAWSLLTDGTGAFDLLGIGGATANTTNRLAVAALATLLNHAGAGHQLKINKAAAANTASLMFQDAFSGRAEMGLAGNDNFTVKVSADGSAWTDAMVIDRTTGAMTLPPGGLLGGGRLKSVQKFTASGTWTRPAGIRAIVVEVIGGGGGGGGASGVASNIGAGAGGGAGAYNCLFLLAPAASYAVIVGAGGAAGDNTGGNGGAGGTSSFNGAACQAAGGSGGNGQVAGTAGAFTTGGDGGLASPTTTPKWGHGAVGRMGQRVSGTLGCSGDGGAGPFGGGGRGRVASNSGDPATSPGSGGGGALSTNATARAGGAGADGLVVVWEYE